MRHVAAAIVAVAFGHVSSARALDAFEIQTYSAEINARRVPSLEVHLNHTVVNERDPAFFGQLSSAHLTHVTFEFALGVTAFFEAGAYLQAAVAPAPQLLWGGAKARGKLVVPAEVAGRWNFGVNLEVSCIPHAFEAQLWGGEVRPILGYDGDGWQVLVNPIVEVNFGGSQPFNFSPAVKAYYLVHAPYALGVEYYASAGAYVQGASSGSREQYLFGTLDLIDAPLELNVGVGAGLSDVSSRLVVKAIVGHSLGS